MDAWLQACGLKRQDAALRRVDWRSAVKPARDGCVLEVEVVPGSRESRFPAGYDAWRGRLEAKVRAPPEDGHANAELCGMVADTLRVPSSQVRVTSGQTSRRKSLTVTGVSADAAIVVLGARL